MWGTWSSEGSLKISVVQRRLIKTFVGSRDKETQENHCSVFYETYDDFFHNRLWPGGIFMHSESVIWYIVFCKRNPNELGRLHEFRYSTVQRF